MSGHSITTYARVQVHLRAPRTLRLLVQPCEHISRVPPLPSGRNRREVIDIHVTTPGQVVAQAEAGHCKGGGTLIWHGGNQAVPSGALPLVHLLDELIS